MMDISMKKQHQTKPLGGCVCVRRWPKGGSNDNNERPVLIPAGGAGVVRNCCAKAKKKKLEREKKCGAPNEYTHNCNFRDQPSK